jgi:carboxypeptidase C (cathepsin A)
MIIAVTCHRWFPSDKMTMPLSRTRCRLLSNLAIGVWLVSCSSAQDNRFSSKYNYKYNKNDFVVTGLEEVEPAFGDFDGVMYAGQLPVDRHDNATRGAYQFWLFAPDHPTVAETLLVWFNGGPGCTSFNAGLLMEHSPVTVPPHRAGYCCSRPFPPLQVNPYSWTKATYMLYVEQPAGTGFSTGIEPLTETDVARDMVDWLVNFYRVFHDLADYQLFVFGESYAGKCL